ncbi:hypothetical protein ABDZ14_13320, partial [Mycobacterium canetti]
MGSDSGEWDRHCRAVPRPVSSPRCAGLRGFSSGRSTARIVAALCWIARLLLGPFHGPYRRRAVLDCAA